MSDRIFKCMCLTFVVSCLAEYPSIRSCPAGVHPVRSAASLLSGKPEMLTCAPFLLSVMIFLSLWAKNNLTEGCIQVDLQFTLTLVQAQRIFALSHRTNKSYCLGAFFALLVGERGAWSCDKQGFHSQGVCVIKQDWQRQTSRAHWWHLLTHRVGHRNQQLVNITICWPVFNAASHRLQWENFLY